MIMASEMINYLVDHIAKFGDSPCVMEHFSSNDSSAIVEPINNVVSMTISQIGSDHYENCVVLLKRDIDNISDWLGGST